MLYQLSYEASWRRRKDSQGPRYEVSRVTFKSLVSGRNAFGLRTQGPFPLAPASIAAGMGLEPTISWVTTRRPYLWDLSASLATQTRWPKTERSAFELAISPQTTERSTIQGRDGACDRHRTCNHLFTRQELCHLSDTCIGGKPGVTRKTS
jgi:hypothetical protein